MKRIVYALTALLILISLAACINTVSYAQTKKHVEDALIALEKENGYVPGRTSSVVNNCFAFVSDVCEKLYGVSYYYEQMDGNYKFKHTSGNYYTVAVKTYPYSGDASVRKNYAKQIKEWILLNAAEGDVLQYGCADPNYSKKHTIIIQHLDDEKMQFFHSNYETMNIPSSACRLDSIYWDSFLKNPTVNDYDGDAIHSMNLLFGSHMKLTGGMGMSLNRCSNLESKYYLDVCSKKVPDIIKTERTSISSVKIQWQDLKFAEKYSVEMKLSSDKNWTLVSNSVKSNSYDFKKLKTGSTYQFRVRANINNAWYDYSNPVSKSVLPPKPGTVKTDHSSPYGIHVLWSGRDDITGCRIYRSTQKNGAYSCIASLAGSIASYTDKTAAYNTVYYYKVQRYVTISGKTYNSELSDPVYAKYTVCAPDNLNTERKKSSSVRVYWTGVENALGYKATAVNTADGKSVTVTVQSNEVIFDNLIINCYYDFFVSAYSAVGESNHVVKRLQTLPPTPQKPAASLVSGGIRISWNSRSDINGSVVYRSTSKNGTYKKIAKIDNKTSHYLDSNISYGKTYYYKVARYEKHNAKTVYSPKSGCVSAKMTLKKPDVSVSRNTSSSVKVTYSAIGNASSYTVRYRPVGAKKYTYIKTKKKSCTIKKLSTGKTYDISVRANNSFGSGSYSKNSKIKVMPAKPQLTLKIASDAICLKWDKRSDITGYKIYRASSKNGKYVLIKDINNKNTQSYKDKNIKYSKTYYYKIKSFVKKKGKLYFSASSAKKLKYALSKPEKPNLKRKSSASVFLSWRNVAGAKKYDIYYKENNGKWHKVSSKKNEKVIKGLKKGTGYSFKVKAVNGLGKSEYSPVALYTVQ